MELKDYTTEELREELKRRAKEARQNAIREKPKYIEVEGIVTNIDNIYKSFIWAEYTVKIEDERVQECYRTYKYYIKQGNFRKHNVPKIGDTVIVGHLLTKNRNYFSPIYAKIIKVIKRKEE